MYKKSLLRPILIVGMITMLFAACDKDFNNLGSDIVGDDHYGFVNYDGATVKAYNQKLGPIASNNLPINPLGFYSNPTFGDTEANFVTQLELSTINPVFNNTDTDLYEKLPSMDSVVMDIPYFKNLETTNTDQSKVYTLDSIYGVTPFDKDDATTNNSKFKLSVYTSNYYLRDLDPEQSLGAQQMFYTDQNGLIDANKDFLLNNAPNTNPADGHEGTHNSDGHERDHFYFDKREHKLTTYEKDGVTKKYTRYVPSMRMHLDTLYFRNKIIDAPSGQLVNNAVFKNYFRGIYFKVEKDNNNPANMAMINFKAGKITIYYKEDKITPDNVNTTENERKVERVSKSFVLNLSGNSISLLHNSNEDTDYLSAANSSQEASKLYLKGGEGSMSVIDLFGTTDLKGLIRNPHFDSNRPESLTNQRFTWNPAYKPELPISDTNKKYLYTGPNGVPDELDDIKENGWLINEANLIFYIDRASMAKQSLTNPAYQTIEPNRIFLYDLTHKKTLLDYTYDITSNSAKPKYNKYMHDGILQKKDIADGVGKRGQKYRVRITNYVRSLIKNDSTNVRLGLSVTESINNVGFSKLRTPNSNSSVAPAMSVLSPLGTILYGTGPTTPDLPEDKKLKLEIYYTKPN